MATRSSCSTAVRALRGCGPEGRGLAIVEESAPSLSRPCRGDPSRPARLAMKLTLFDSAPPIFPSTGTVSDTCRRAWAPGGNRAKLIRPRRHPRGARLVDFAHFSRWWRNERRSAAARAPGQVKECASAAFANPAITRSTAGAGDQEVPRTGKQASSWPRGLKLVLQIGAPTVRPGRSAPSSMPRPARRQRPVGKGRPHGGADAPGPRGPSNKDPRWPSTRRRHIPQMWWPAVFERAPVHSSPDIRPPIATSWVGARHVRTACANPGNPARYHPHRDARRRQGA